MYHSYYNPRLQVVSATGGLCLSFAAGQRDFWLGEMEKGFTEEAAHDLGLED